MNDDGGGLLGDDRLIARLIGYGIAAVIALVLALAPLGVLAQTPQPVELCLPGNAVFRGTGSDYRVFETAAVHGEIGWCPQPDGMWRLVTHSWCLKTECNKAPPNAWSLVLAAAARVAAAPNLTAQIRAEWATAGIPLRTDLERWQRADWFHQACQWMTSTQPGVSPRPPVPVVIPGPEVPVLLPMDFCNPSAPGPAPPCPAGPAAWTQGAAACDAAYPGGASGASVVLADTTAPTTGTAMASCVTGAMVISAPLCLAAAPPPAAYVVTPDGTKPARQWFLAIQQPSGVWKRSTTPSGTTPVGAPCDCEAISILEFNITRYCKAPVPGVPNAVTACVKK